MLFLTFLSSYWKPLLAIVAIAGLVFSGVYLSGVWYARGKADQALIDKEAALKAAEADETKIIAAVHSNDDELADLRAYRASHPDVPVHVGVCNAPARVSPPGVAGAARTSSAPPVVLQPVPTPDTNGVSDADRGAMLGRLAERADEVSAQLRAVAATR